MKLQEYKDTVFRLIVYSMAAGIWLMLGMAGFVFSRYPVGFFGMAGAIYFTYRVYQIQTGLYLIRMIKE